MNNKERIKSLERRIKELERKEQQLIIIKVAPVIVPVTVPEPPPVWPWPTWPPVWRPYDYITTGDPVPQYHYTTAGDTAGPLNLGFPSIAGPDGTIISLIG